MLEIDQILKARLCASWLRCMLAIPDGCLLRALLLILIQPLSRMALCWACSYFSPTQVLLLILLDLDCRQTS